MLVVLLALLAQQSLHPTPAASAPVVVTPPSLKVDEVTAGESHTCLLKPDGGVACWGGYGADVSPPAGPFTSISVAGSRTCGLKQDRSIVCWGVDFGPQQVSGAYVSMSAGGDDFGCALEADDKGVTCWWLGEDEATITHVLDGPMVAVDAGLAHACGIKPDQSIVCWGANEFDQAPSRGLWLLPLGQRWRCQHLRRRGRR